MCTRACARALCPLIPSLCDFLSDLLLCVVYVARCDPCGLRSRLTGRDHRKYKRLEQRSFLRSPKIPQASQHSCVSSCILGHSPLKLVDSDNAHRLSLGNICRQVFPVHAHTYVNYSAPIAQSHTHGRRLCDARRFMRVSAPKSARRTRRPEPCAPRGPRPASQRRPCRALALIFTVASSIMLRSPNISMVSYKSPDARVRTTHTRTHTVPTSREYLRATNGRFRRGSANSVRSGANLDTVLNCAGHPWTFTAVHRNNII